MQDAIAEADAAPGRPECIAALRRAVDAYTGPLADGCGYDWLRDYQYGPTQQAAAASLRLADELADRPEEARAVLAAAIDHHPYAEPFYQAAMRLAARRGDVDAVRALKRALTHRLDEIDIEPSDDTLVVAEECVALANRSARRRGSQR